MTFRNAASEFIFTRTYARWIDDLGRRETWQECVQRVMGFYKETAGDKVPKKVYAEIEEQMLEFGTMPSMRLAWAAGEAARRENVCAYNCSFVPIIDLKAFSEVLYILMCGTGVGFSVEQRFISKLPVVKTMSSEGLGVHVVGDSKEGWAEALLTGLTAWFNGKDVEFDYTQVRPRGARLKVMGGRSSGPDPLKKLLDFARTKIIGAQGRQLSDLEVHDIVCMIAEIVVVGGVRRSSLISFSDIHSESMRHAKDWPMPPYRFMANNSAVYDSKPDAVTFLKEWTALAASGSGERGIYNVSNLKKYSKRRDFENHAHRSNPCGEILLRPFQFCNLSEVVVRAEDTFDDLIQKVKVAVWMGAIQSTLTKFNFIRDEFRKNCEEERLLGVSLTGQMDNPKLMTDEKLEILKSYAIKTARAACKALEINMSVSITTGKPSGTVSQLVDAASGCHPRHAEHYIRRYRISGTDPLFRMMRDQGFKFAPENGQAKKDWDRAARAWDKLQAHKDGISVLSEDDERKAQNDLVSCSIYRDGQDWSEDKVQTWVTAFPMKSPKGAINRHQVSAIDQLNWYLKIQNNWCEHNQSTTVYVRDDEWVQVGQFVYENFDKIIGVSFLPHDGGRYEQAPYEDITKEQYERMAKDFPVIDYSKLGLYEREDNTTGAQNLACVSGVCELP